MCKKYFSNGLNDSEMFQETHTMRLFNAIATLVWNSSACHAIKSKLKSQSQVNFLVGSSLIE